jgi:putative ABC transport system ATP-binding protein
MPDSPHLRTIQLSRYYVRGRYTVRALDNASLSVGRGEYLSIVGASGSGKSTLLNLMAGLDTPTGGTVEVDGEALSGLSRRALSSYRAHKVGIIFQSFNLIAHYTSLQNVETALLFTGVAPKERKLKATAILEELGMSERLDHRPADLSGGEQQRVAVARAIVKNPEVLFADEPTGNLDFENSQAIASLLTQLNGKGLTIVLITHNLEMAKEYTHRTIRMSYGKIIEGMDVQPQAGGAPS